VTGSHGTPSHHTDQQSVSPSGIEPELRPSQSRVRTGTPPHRISRSHRARSDRILRMQAQRPKARMGTMTIVRRFLVLLTLLFWQGGFTFYAAVVVPIGTQVLGSTAEQGRITRRVTPYLNLSGVAGLVFLGWDIGAGRDPLRRRRRLRWLTWLLL